MKYEYKVIALCEWDRAMYSDDFEPLQKWFDNGWEYVDTIQQNASAAGQSSYARYPAVGVILRKEKENIML